MKNINEILDFSFSKNGFSEKGRSIIPTHILSLCQSRISTLNAITQKIGNSMIDEKPTKGIREVYVKFLKISQSNNGFNDKFDKRELRTLTYALTYKEHQEDSIFENLYYLQLCFSLLNTNWRDSFISGLLDCYLSNWGSSNKESLNFLSKFLTSKIKSYDGTRSLFQSLKINSKFFDKDKGDIDLGATLAISNKSLSEATKFLSLPDHWITYSYFSGVINGYFEKSKNKLEMVIDDISETLERHSNSTKATNPNKLILSKIICHTANSSDLLQDKVKDIAFKLVGDPGIISIWRPFENANPTEILTINKAREVLNEWVTRQFINVFFEKCFIDERRKLFWLKFSKKIVRFKVVGSNSIFNLLKNDKRISEILKDRFAFTNSAADRNSALMFVMGEYLFIEFSDEGAFYAYKLSNKNAPSIENVRFQSTSYLKNPNFNWLAYRKGYTITSTNYEGKLGHNDGDAKWEQVADYWIKNIAGINV